MSEAEFDASRVFDGQSLDQAVENQHFNAVHSCRGDVNALGLLLDQSKRELQESVFYCNHKAWGYWDRSVGPPTSAQATALIERMDSRFALEARDAHRLRKLCADVSVALEKAKANAFEDMHERGRKSQEADDLAAFEAHEANERQRRFEEWRASR